MIFATVARTDIQGIVASFNAGQAIKAFRHSGGWSVECPAGILVDAGTDQFAELEPLVNMLEENGIRRLMLEL